MGAAVLQFSDLIRPECIIADLRAQSRDEALTIMARRLVADGYCMESFVDAILERERVHPSGLPMPGPKIAIPHTDADHVQRSVVLFARLKKPVTFHSMGGPDETFPVRMVSMFALKEKKLIGDMLETLITVYQHQETLEAILDAADGREIFSVLREAVQALGTS